jgi:excisionase family DNA binding protein
MDTAAPESQFVTVAAAAETLSISETTVRRLIGAGLLPAVRVSPGALRIERNELAGWISGRRAASSAVGSGSSADAVGHSSSVDTPAERDGTSSSREAVEPAQLAGEEQR